VDFPANWPTLLPEMIEKLKTQDFNVINGVLKTLHAVFKKYASSIFE
jgi:exportin-2 (importin alpha re-exporter)